MLGLAARKDLSSDFSPKAPIFLAIDPSKPGKSKNEGLKERAEWRCDVPLASVSSQQGPRIEGVTALPIASSASLPGCSARRRRT